MGDSDCLFCDIVRDKKAASRVLETKEFIVIENKYPKAPVHLLVVDKTHREKSDTMAGVYQSENYWDKLFYAVSQAVIKLNLDIVGYKVVINESKYYHYGHEHVHVIGGEIGGVESNEVRL